MGSAVREYPASYAQRGMWHAFELAPESSVYHVTVRADVSGHLDMAALRAAAGRLAQRHDVLRTTFRSTGDELSARVHDDLPVPVTEVHVADRDPDGFEDRVRHEARIPFRLTEEGPLRIVLLDGAPDRQVLLFVFHHMSWDFESIVLALRELGELYQDGLTRAGRDPGGTHREGAAGYAAFAEWEHTWVAGPEGEESQAYWAQQWADLPEALDLPSRRPRQAARSYTGAMHWTELEPTHVTGLDQLARDAGVTRYAVLLTAFTVLLSRFADQHEVTVGLAGSQRTLPEHRWTLGNFVNPLVLRSDVRPERTFRDLVTAGSRTVFAALRHRIVPFPLLVQRQRPDYDTSRAPVFDVLFAYDKPHNRDQDLLARFVAGRGETRWGDLLLRSRPLDCAETFYDLTTYVFDSSSAVAVRWEYNTDVLTDEAVAGLGRHFGALLSALLAAPDTPVGELVVDEPAESVATQETGISTASLVAAHAAAAPDRPALHCAGRVLSYGELHRSVERLADQLRAVGAGPGTEVAIRLPRSVGLVVALLAVDGVGGSCRLVDPHLDPPPGSVHLVVTEAGITRNSGAADAGPPATTDGDGGHLELLLARYPLDGRDRVLQHEPVTSRTPLAEFRWPLAAGAQLVLAPPDADGEPAGLAALLARERPTVVQLRTETLPAAVIEPLPPLPGLRRALCRGDVPSLAQVRQLRRWTGVEPDHLYLVDGTPVGALSEVDTADGFPLLDRPPPGVRPQLLDADGHPVPPHAVGVLTLSAPAPAGSPAQTSGPGILTCTGRLARREADGRIRLHGRASRRVRVGGYRVDLDEVERLLEAQPAVREAVVVTSEDQGRARMAAFLVPHRADGSGLRELREALSRQRARYLVPAEFHRIAQVPRDRHGRIDLAALTAPAADPDSEYTPPATPLERELALMWGDLLGVEKIGRHDDFFHSGGHSLLATRVSAEVKDRFGVALPVRTIFVSSTLERYAVAVLQALVEVAGAELVHHDKADAGTATGRRRPIESGGRDDPNA